MADGRTIWERDGVRIVEREGNYRYRVELRAPSGEWCTVSASDCRSLSIYEAERLAVPSCDTREGSHG